ncbi:MAG: hypothetical protein HYT80_08060 [Euryarchaeota archaeon]|nr:hypothetical protein [Euryarchaeota archaeon]
MSDEIVPAQALAPKMRRFQEKRGGAPTVTQLFDRLEALDALKDLGAIRHMQAL